MTDRYQARSRTNRRSFMKLAAAGVLLTAGRPEWSSAQGIPASPPGGPLTLDGQLLVDETARQAVANDNGGHVSHLPMAVVKPRSVDDVVRAVVHANKHRLKIAMRGQGHSQYGQSQVEGGIVIDSSTLSGLSWHRDGAIDAQPGALWGDVATMAFAQKQTPPVMPDAMMLTVGGTLSVGGIGETTYRYGAQVDHVLELDVVTGAGELVTCSAESNQELFRMTLAGLGQCGIIVRARLRLMRAPQFVAIHQLTYDEVDPFLADQATLTKVAALGPLNGQITKDKDGRLRIVLLAGRFIEAAEEESRSPDWMNGLHFKSGAPARTTSYMDYLNRRTASATASRARRTANATLVATLPDNAVRPFLTHVLTTPEAFAGIWLLEVSAKIPARHTQPLQKTSSGDLGYELRMQRRASAVNAPDHKAMLASNQTLVPRLQAAGGKIYPPYCPILSKEQWQNHYGRETWQRFAAAKKRFDPNNVLTPGAGIF